MQQSDGRRKGHGTGPSCGTRLVGLRCCLIDKCGAAMLKPRWG